MTETKKRDRYINRTLLAEYTTDQTSAADNVRMRRAAEYAANVGLVVHAFDAHTQSATSTAAKKYKGPLKSDRFVTTYLCDNEVERLQLYARWTSMVVYAVTAEEKRDQAEEQKQIRLEIQHWQELRERVAAGEEIPRWL